MALKVWFLRGPQACTGGVDLLAEALESGGLYWLDLENGDLPLLEPYRSLLPGHPLNWEDAEKPNQRPKWEEHPDNLFLIMRALDLSRPRLAEQLCTLQLACFLTLRGLITLRSAPMQSVSLAQERLARLSLRLEEGPDALLHAILDDLVDHYGPHVEQWEQEMDHLLREALDRPRQRVMARILLIRKHMLNLRRIAFGQREILSRLVRGGEGFIRPQRTPYFQDVLDHLVTLVEASETLRDSVSIAVDVYLNSVNNRLGEVMKILTVMSAIMLPLTVITGVYGMNFDAMPGLHHPNAFYWLMGFMALLVSGMLVYFRKSKWL